MSSLRVETLRLSWLEAFIAVVDNENISEAARELGVNQSTVTRYMQELQGWLGKDLIVVGQISDPQNPSLSIATTEAGREFYDIATRCMSDLAGFRDERAERRDIIVEIGNIISKMEADQKRRTVLDTTQLISENIESFGKIRDLISEDYPIDLLKGLRISLRAFFSRYESQRNAEKRRRRRRPAPAPHVAAEQ